MEAEARACEIVAEALKVQGGVTPEDTIATLASWDSLSHMAIVFAVEAEIGRHLEADEIASIDSVKSVAGLLAVRGGVGRRQ